MSPRFILADRRPTLGAACRMPSAAVQMADEVVGEQSGPGHGEPSIVSAVRPLGTGPHSGRRAAGGSCPGAHVVLSVPSASRNKRFTPTSVRNRSSWLTIMNAPR
ncbi:hypothetical protein Srufu_004470 [Streptomyces libani subsp. rufus]|nr:hypothetical protein Srufu_004470 [Streptomyces libani subsp. rufus]